MNKEIIKEKFEKAKTKVEEAVVKAKKSVDNFVNTHPTLVKGIVLTGIIGGAAALGAINSRNNVEQIMDSSNSSSSGNPYTGERGSLWKEEYRENYDKVNAFADTLKLADGEMFIIEDQKQYIDADLFPNLNPARPIVSHMIYGDGVYPNE